MEKHRKNIHLFYLGMAKQAAERSTCIRKRFGSVLVVDDEIVSVGANYSPYPIKGCTEVGSCFRREKNIPSHTRMDVCRALTSEQCTVMKGGRSISNAPGSILYTYGINNETEEPIRGFPHQVSVKFLLMAGVTAVVMRSKDKELGYEMFHVGTSNFAEDAGHIQL